MDKKSLFAASGSYIIWGLLPYYWAQLDNLSPLVVLANRIIWSAVFTFILILFLRQNKEFLALFKDARVLKLLIPASIVVSLNWGLYIWAVNSDHILDASLGYYINPLTVFLCGVFIFKEKFGKAELAAILFALVGVIIISIQVGEIPFIALILAISFSIYGVFKKHVQIDGLHSVSIETILILPLALLFSIFAPVAQDSYAQASVWQYVLLAGSGIMTALPLVLYSHAVNNLSLITVGLLQFINPTMLLFISIFEGEDISSRIIGFVFIWIGLLIFILELIRRDQKELKRLRLEAASSPEPAIVGSFAEEPLAESSGASEPTLSS